MESNLTLTLMGLVSFLLFCLFSPSIVILIHSHKLCWIQPLTYEEWVAYVNPELNKHGYFWFDADFARKAYYKGKTPKEFTDYLIKQYDNNCPNPNF